MKKYKVQIHLDNIADLMMQFDNKDIELLNQAE